MSMLILAHSLTQAHYMTKEEKNKLTRNALRHWYENHQEEYWAQAEMAVHMLNRVEDNVKFSGV